MGRQAALIGALCLLGCAQSPPPSPAAALQAVLAYQAALPREPTPICVPATTRGIAFERDRQELRWARDSRPNNAADVARRRQQVSAHEHPAFAWQVPGRPGARAESRPPPDFDPALANELSAAAGRIIASDPPAAPPMEIGPLPPPFRRPPGCDASLSLTAPAFADDLAFVETGYGCGPLCGNGTLFALRRHGGEWRLIAIAQTWIA